MLKITRKTQNGTQPLSSILLWLARKIWTIAVRRSASGGAEQDQQPDLGLVIVSDGIEIAGLRAGYRDQTEKDLAITASLHQVLHPFFAQIVDFTRFVDLLPREADLLLAPH